MYKIPVKWGQRPVVSATSPKSVTEAVDSIGVGFADPMRYEANESLLSVYDDEASVGAVAPSDYAWYAQKSPRQGYYFLWFGMGTKGEGDITGVEQPYEFAVALDGEPADGGPDWTPTYEDGPEPSDEPIQFDGASAPKETSKDGSDDVQAAEESSSPGWLLPALIGVGVLFLLLLGLFVFLVARKKRN